MYGINCIFCQSKGDNMKRSMLAILLVSCLLQASDDNHPYNSYQGTPITKETLLQFAPKTPGDIQPQVNELLNNHLKLFEQLTQTPSNLKKGVYGSQDKKNAEALEQHEEIVENLGGFHLVRKFKK